MENKNLKFGISNFRVFDYTEDFFEFAPITFLTGPNSSGKSSIMKAMLLLKENFDGEHIPLELKFNSFDNKLSSVQEVLKHKESGIEIRLKTTLFKYIGADIEIYYDNGSYDKYDNGVINYDDNSYCELLLLKINNQIVFQIAPKNKFNDYESFLHPNDCYLNYKIIRNTYLTYLKKEIESLENQIELLSNFDESHEYYNYFQISIKEYKRDIELKNRFLKNKDLNIFELDHEDEILKLSITDELRDKFKLIENQIFHDDNKFNHKYIDVTSDNYESFIKYFSKLKPKTEEYNFNWQLDSNRLIDTFIEFCFNLFWLELDSVVNKEIGSFNVKLSEFGKDLKEFCKTQFHSDIVKSISPFNKIETIPISKNSGETIFDKNRKPTSFLEESIQHYERLMQNGINSLKTNFLIDKWLSKDKFGIGKDIKIETWKNLISLSITDFNNRETNISNLGFGVGQIFSLLLLPFELPDFKIYPDDLEIACLEAARSNNKIIYLEEPESNLHPKWQSLLVELLSELHQKFGYRFIIETHSEYMIRKAQFLVAKDNKCQKDFKIYYFNGPIVEKSEKKFFEIKINNNGMLDKDFGSGFFDESTNLTLELLRINSLN